MSRYDKDSVDGRIEREYRYHPDMWMRKYIKYLGMLVIPCTLLTVIVAYYVSSGGRSVAEGDMQYVLNVLRQTETSPRSKLYVYREGCDEEEENHHDDGHNPLNAPHDDNVKTARRVQTTGPVAGPAVLARS